MTGFGRCIAENGAYIQQWEIKSVNGKFLDIKWRLPQIARSLEAGLEKIVRQSVSRGRVEISLRLQYAKNEAAKAGFDSALAGARLDKLRELAQSRGEAFAPDYGALMSVPELWECESLDEDDDLAIFLESGLNIAIEDWNESRGIEGARLAADLRERFLLLEEWTETLRSRAPEIREERIAAMRERLVELLENGVYRLDEDRFLQEVAILSDRLDVSEELTRLGCHIERLNELLERGGECGRKLDFTLQECFREINTLGNKSPDPGLSRLVVDFKNELEKCREQAQNLE